MQVGIVAQRDNDRAAALAARLRTELDADGVGVAVDEATASTIDDAAGVAVGEMAACDLVVSIGGDGTFLYAARGAGTTPIMGVNLGEVGFLNAVDPADAVEEVRTEVDRMRERGTGRVRTVARVAARGDGWSVPPAINEVSVLGRQRGRDQGVDVTVSVDGNEYADGHADGVLVATPTGSTAYNLSEGGPIVHPTVESLVVTEMAATDGMPPLVVGNDSTVTVEVAGASEAVVVSDGRVSEEIPLPAAVTIERADEPLTVAGPPLDFFGGLGKLA